MSLEDLKSATDAMTREQVVQAYRLILGREPESPEVVERYAQQFKDHHAFRQILLSSSEFRDQFDRIHPPKRPQRGIHGSKMDVQVDVTDEELAALCAKTAAQWQHLGETEPYWSVITNANFFMERFEANRERFFESGEAEVQDMLTAIDRNHLTANFDGTCLELGCGVGRVTRALSKRFNQVIAADISDSHIALAKQQLQEAAQNNIQFLLLKHPTDLSSAPQIDFFYTKLVLQHNPPPLINVLLKQALALLRPSGLGLFQIPVYKSGYQFFASKYLRHHNETEMEVHFFPQHILLKLIAEAGCRLCEIQEDDAIGLAQGVVSNTLLVQKASA